MEMHKNHIFLWSAFLYKNYFSHNQVSIINTNEWQTCHDFLAKD